MLQCRRHVALAVALVLGAVAVVSVDDGLGGTTHADWQVDPCELQPIMQLLTAEVCASRIGPAAHAPPAIALIASAATKIVKPRMTALRGSANASGSIARLAAKP